MGHSRRAKPLPRWTISTFLLNVIFILGKKTRVFLLPPFGPDRGTLRAAGHSPSGAQDLSFTPHANLRFNNFESSHVAKPATLLDLSSAWCTRRRTRRRTRKLRAMTLFGFHSLTWARPSSTVRRMTIGSVEIPREVSARERMSFLTSSRSRFASVRIGGTAGTASPLTCGSAGWYVLSP